MRTLWIVGALMTLSACGGSGNDAQREVKKGTVGSATTAQRFLFNSVVDDTRYLLLVNVDAEARSTAILIVNDAPPVNLNGSLLDPQIEAKPTSGNYRFEGQLQ